MLLSRKHPQRVYASILANNAPEYDEALIAEHLERAWNGAVFAAAEEEKA